MDDLEEMVPEELELAVEQADVGGWLVGDEGQTRVEEIATPGSRGIVAGCIGQALQSLPG